MEGQSQSFLSLLETPFAMLQPQCHDIVGQRVHVGGFGTGFEAEVTARVRDANGVEIASRNALAGNFGARSFQIAVDLEDPPATPTGFVDAFWISPAEPSEDPLGERDKTTVPVVLGAGILADYQGFSTYRVRIGDSLSAIAQQAYGDPGKVAAHLRGEPAPRRQSGSD